MLQINTKKWTNVVPDQFVISVIYFIFPFQYAWYKGNMIVLFLAVKQL